MMTSLFNTEFLFHSITVPTHFKQTGKSEIRFSFFHINPDVLVKLFNVIYYLMLTLTQH